MTRADLLVPVENDGGALGSEAVLVGVRADTGHLGQGAWGGYESWQTPSKGCLLAPAPQCGALTQHTTQCIVKGIPKLVGIMFFIVRVGLKKLIVIIRLLFIIVLDLLIILRRFILLAWHI